MTSHCMGATTKKKESERERERERDVFFSLLFSFKSRRVRVIDNLANSFSEEDE